MPGADPVLSTRSARLQLEPMRLALLWLTGASSAIVFIEPSPYEVVSLATLVAFAITGLTFRASLIPLAAFLVLINLGYTIAAVPVLDHENTGLWVITSWYLAGTSVFFAAMLGENTQSRAIMLMRGYTTAAVIVSVAAIGGYFHLFGAMSEAFLRYGRAKGTFNDPNVLGAFLCAPALFAFYRTLTGRGSAWLANVLLLTLFSAALLLTFSRGAWAQILFSAIVLMGLTFVTSSSPRDRLRIVLTAAVGTALLLCILLALVSIGPVGELLSERASLAQNYDVGPLGRFGRHVLGFALALDHPLGIGPLQFSRYFPEDPHNSYLNAFVSGGWLSGLAYLALIGATLAIATRSVLAATPFRAIMLVVYAAFVGCAAESTIIDSDHWRHYALLTGVLWGLASAASRQKAAQRVSGRVLPGGLARTPVAA